MGQTIMREHLQTGGGQAQRVAMGALDSVAPPRQRPQTQKPAQPRQPRNQPVASEEKANDARFAKYEKKKKFGLPMAAIANIMRKDGMSEADIATFTGEAQPKSAATKAIKKPTPSGGGRSGLLLDVIRAGTKLRSANKPRKVGAKAKAKVQKKPNLMDQLKNRKKRSARSRSSPKLESHRCMTRSRTSDST